MKPFLTFSAFLLPMACAPLAAAPFKTPAKIVTPTAAPISKAEALQGDARIVHALNRLGFGPRPGDVERVRKMGLGQ